MRRAISLALVGGLLALNACTAGPEEEPIRIGAVYPLSGTQGAGGVEEFRGVQVAVELANADGGVRGRPIELVPIDVPGADAAPGAIEELDDLGVRLILGSYGSTISSPAAEAAARRGLLFWETGAVGEMTGGGAGELVFRVAPSGAVLGRNAIGFVADEYAPVLGRDPSTLRYAVTLVDDAYGRAVAQGGIDEIRARGFTLSGTFAYDPRTVDMDAFVRRPRDQPARRHLRVGLPAGRDRHAPRDGATGPGHPGRDRDLVELLHAGVRRRARRRGGGTVRLGQAGLRRPERPGPHARPDAPCSNARTRRSRTGSASR